MTLLFAPKHLFLVVGLLLLATVTHAARLDNLFRAEVDAAGRDSTARDAALAAALQDVLVRVTGDEAVFAEPAAKSLLKNPGRFVEQYRFREVPAGPADPVEQLRLWVQFDGVALSREIRQAGLPYWGRERPDVLVWLAIDDRGRRYLVSETSESHAATTLLQAARKRGLPLTLPLMDLEDQRAIRFTDVWGGFVGTVEAASMRYRPQVVLVGKLDRSNPDTGWRTEWNLLGSGATQSWTSHAGDLTTAVERGISDASGLLAAQYAVASAGGSSRTLVVEGVNDLEAYARVSRYLAALTPVEQVQVTRVDGPEVEFNLRLSADERSLLQVITLGKMLQSLDEPSSWRFRYNP